MCLANAHRTLRPLVCPICTAPMRRREPEPEEMTPAERLAYLRSRGVVVEGPEPAGPDLPVVGDFAVAPEEEVE